MLVRHGLSEGNLARAQSKRGDCSAYTDQFRARRNREWRLTDLGIAQARAALDAELFEARVGAWIGHHVAPTF